jgi:hypothetical protein
MFSVLPLGKGEKALHNAFLAPFEAAMPAFGQGGRQPMLEYSAIFPN